jgi:cellulose synthase/poly-beta-1,6-N-acetylglucosamine synthase-like glycosyltransferase
MVFIFFALICAFALFYLIQSLIFTYGLYLFPKTKSHPNHPFISIVVAARNEEKNIGNTLESLVRIDYPRDKFEIIISDGASTDRTCEVVKSYIEQFPFIRLHHADQNRPIRGKANAIHQAVEIAKGEFILMTDADCKVEPTWAKSTVDYFTDEVGLVCGITIPQPKDWFSAMQTLDWCYILSVSSARASIGFPIGGIGNNFSYRKKTYEEIGGYEQIKFSITEDFALFQAILKSRWKIAFPLLYETHNRTEPMPNLHELYDQKKRWTLGGLDAKVGQAMLAGAMFAVHLLSIVAFFILPFPIALFNLVLKFLSDFILILSSLSRLKLTKWLWAFFFFELYYYAFVFVVPIVLAFSRNIEWKGLSYNLGKKK